MRRIPRRHYQLTVARMIELAGVPVAALHVTVAGTALALRVDVLIHTRQPERYF